VFENVVLAEYRRRYDWRDHTIKDIREGVLYPTRLASPQGTLLPMTPQDSVVVYRARPPKRRAAPPVPCTPVATLRGDGHRIRSASFPTGGKVIMTRVPYRCAVGVRAETLVPVGYPRALRPDKRRPCNHWCGGQPVDETGAGQACGDEWWLRSGWAKTPLSRFYSSVLTGSGYGPFLSCQRPSHAQTPLATPTP
jgi:hypothetical protein